MEGDDIWREVCRAKDTEEATQSERSAVVSFLRAVAARMPSAVRSRYGATDEAGLIADEFGKMVDLIADDIATGAHRKTETSSSSKEAT